MPLTKKGNEIMQNMEKEYGPKKGESVFYASKNAGRISGVDAAHAAIDAAQNPTYRVDRGVLRGFNDITASHANDSFNSLEHKFEREGKSDPGGLAYHIGVEKYGKAGMAHKAAEGRKE